MASPARAPAAARESSFFFMVSYPQYLFDLGNIAAGNVGDGAVGQGNADGAGQVEVKAADLVQVDDLRMGDADKPAGIQPLLQLVQAQPQAIFALRGDGVHLA